MSIGTRSVTAAQLPTGSEFRATVAALMMAKSLWMTTGIELNKINKMERKFLLVLAADFDLYVDKETYIHWVGLLEGLVMAKGRGSWQWWGSCQTLVSIGPYQTEAGPKAPSSILWRVPTWQAIADHGRVCYVTTSLQSHLCLPVTHTFRHPCCLLSIRIRIQPRQAPPFRCHKRKVSWSCNTAAPYPTIPVPYVGGRCRSSWFACHMSFAVIIAPVQRVTS